MASQNRGNFGLSETLRPRKYIAVDSFQLNADLKQTKIQTVLADLDLAFTFAEVAATSENVETRNRNRANARKAFFAIRDELLPRCSLDESQQDEIYRKLRELRSRLEQLGEHLGAR